VSKDVYYFKHDANASQDLKLKSLRKHYGWTGNGWYWYLIECLRSEDAYKMSYSDSSFEGLSDDMKCRPAKVKEFIDTCLDLKLFTKNGNTFYSERLSRDMEHLDEVRQGRRKAGLVSAAKRQDSGKQYRHQASQDELDDQESRLAFQKEHKAKVKELGRALTVEEEHELHNKYFI
jgi:hypothetical protein